MATGAAAAGAGDGAGVGAASATSAGLPVAGGAVATFAAIAISAHEHGDQKADDQKNGNAADTQYHVEQRRLPGALTLWPGPGLVQPPSPGVNPCS